MKGRFNGYTILGLIMILVFGSHLVSSLATRSDHWWTPRELAQRPTEVRDRVHVLLRDKLITKHLEQGRLYLEKEGGEKEQLLPGDVRVRLNNWPQQKARLYQWVSLFAAGLTAGIMFLGIGVFLGPKIPSLRQTKPPDEAPAE